MTKYAARTNVSVETSRNEIEHTLRRYGAEQFMYGWDKEGAAIAFVVTIESGQKRQVRFSLPLPSRGEHEFTHHSRGTRTADAAEQLALELALEEGDEDEPAPVNFHDWVVSIRADELRGDPQRPARPRRTVFPN